MTSSLFYKITETNNLSATKINILCYKLHMIYP